MNQKQREFLIAEVEKIYRREKEEHYKLRPTRPSLNNHLVAAVLSGSARLKSNAEIAEKIKDKALKLGHDKAFLNSENRYGSSETEKDEKISLRALDIFEVPESYQKELNEYISQFDAWKEKNDAIENLHSSLRIKIQIGSDKVLDELILQADNLGGLKIISSRLTLTTDRLLEEGKK